MSNVHDIADQRPHAVILAENGAHVIPLATFEEVIKGEQPSSVLSEPVIRRIIEEWLEASK